MRALAALAAGAWAAAGALGCGKGCGDGDAVAELVEHAGEVKRGPAQGGGDGDWQAIADGDSFRCEQRAQTGAQGWARVDLRSGGRVRLAAATTIRFACAPGAPVFDLELGEVVVSSGDEREASWMLEIGNARLARGSELRMSAEQDHLRFELIVGEATVAPTEGGPGEALAPGEVWELEVGSAVVRRVEAEAAEPTSAEADTDEPEPAIELAPEITAEIEGRGARVRAPGARNWSALPPGAHVLEPGTAVRLGRRGAVALSGGAGQVRIDAPGELVVGGPEGAMAELRRGAGWLQSDSAELRVRVPGGAVMARRGDATSGRTSVDVGKARTRARALRGEAVLSSDAGGRQVLSPGERGEITRAGDLVGGADAPTRAELIIAAGESPVLHVAAPPTAVGVDVSEVCASGEGMLEVAARPGFAGPLQMSKGAPVAIVRLGLRPRRHLYRVRCIAEGALAEDVAASGSVRVLRDAATRALPRRAPVNTVDADGRRYTVLYQNLLPAISFRWRDSRDSGPYRLHLQPERGSAQVLRSDEPRYQAEAGSLAEGSYSYYFEGARGRSPTSRLSIDFDNAAASAYLRAPAVRAPWTGDTLAIAGAALPGSRVSVAGKALSLDRQGRFSTTLSLPIAGNSVAVRLAHPRMGVHYYLRRAR
ncbi:hypothetical protein [Haliangium ochraceum]|uniref:FecR protein domain-containing protein n=1 Tax=Haliangium ochraceum (strain DSM 14365 / JCM 11303 / SMP-2) TaxID=502025 RepID=D0LRF9_HALO1|nr:hypothetical protein [Haliangium ochraceum]ACY17187.1 hypothetical protein Hoch_4696 [Haliangium ochraceum DSM 14365]